MLIPDQLAECSQINKPEDPSTSVVALFSNISNLDVSFKKPFQTGSLTQKRSSEIGTRKRADVLLFGFSLQNMAVVSIWQHIK